MSPQNPGCSTAMDPDLALNPSLGLDVIVVLGGKQTIHISLFIITFISPVLPRSTGHEPFCFSFSPIS